jgi:serine/threonine protein kinase
MMPALWDALVAARHGDLSAENVLVDLERGRFVLIDPGVCLWSLTSSGADDQHDWMDHRVAFTTTPASYPLLPPTYEAPGEGLEGLGLDAHLRVLGRLGGSFMVGPIIGTAWFRPGDREIERAIVRKTLELEGPPRSEDPRPPAADLLAVGILCFRALTGRHPWPRLAERPLWVGAFGEGAGDPWLAEQTAAVLEEGLPTPDGATEAEADLCRALLGLEIRDREHLFTLARRARA